MDLHKALSRIGRTINPVCILSSLGITSIILWCKLMGHTSAFFVPLAGLGTWANARVFWLLGILIAALTCLLMPRALHKFDAMQRYVIPLIAMVGGAMFAIAFYQTFFDQRLFAVIGVVASGFGYFWFISRFVLMLSLTQGITCLACAFGGAFVLRQALLIAMDALIPLNYQVMVAIALPLCAVSCFELARAAAKKENASLPGSYGRLWGIPTLPKTYRVRQTEGRHLLVIVIAVGLLLSVARACSISGTWGNDHTDGTGPLEAIPQLLLYGAAIFALVYIGIVRVSHSRETSRFIVGVFITITGLLVAALRPFLAWVPHAVLDLIVGTNDPFALVFFWSMVGGAIQCLATPPNRVIGLAGSVYAAASVAWVFLISNENAVSSAFVLTAVYAMFVTAVMVIRLQGTQASWEGGGAAQGQTAPEARTEGPCAPGQDADSAEQVVAAIRGRCDKIAREYALSPRETDVFLLIAQGRSGTAIQEELGVAASTVKTHTQHIYAKLGVGDRQELMDKVLGL